MGGEGLGFQAFGATVAERMTLESVEKRPSAALSGRLTASAAWQEVAPYSSRRHPSPFVVEAYSSSTPHSSEFRVPPQTGFRETQLASGHF